MSQKLAPSPTFVDGRVSYWFREIGLPRPRAPLPGDQEVDVAVVGGGYTGLWTAYYLKRAQPDLRIAVLERTFAGFGASGRNGGWLTAEPVGQPQRYAADAGIDATRALQQEMFRTVDEVIQVAATEGIDAHIHKAGTLSVARNRPQYDRLQEHIREQRRYGWSEADYMMLDRSELEARITIPGALGAGYTPHCARIQPAMLARGLADAVERLGVPIYEGTTVLDLQPRRVLTTHGTVRADVVVRALEGFTATLPGERRTLLPMFSNMVVTEPLPDAVWEQIGWKGCETLGDEGHAFVYLQRTHDGRIALGGRAVPYKFGSKLDVFGETAGNSVSQLRAALLRLFPVLADARIDHAWAGVLGVPRDWCASAGWDQITGLAWAGGYVGHGVAGTNLAGRTLRDLILRRDTELVRLPWVNHKVRSWEPEPLRFLGVHGMYAAYRQADRNEDTRRDTSRIARVADLISGR